MSDCCGCECGTESWSFDLEPFGVNPAYSINNSEEYWTVADTVNAPVLRGDESGWFNYVRPVTCIVHTDWCGHRPTKASVNTTDTLALVPHDNPNGTLRVFVESTRDFSKYVFAEIEVEAFVAFATWDEKHHYADDSTHQVAAYTPVFGTNTGDFIFVPRNAADGTDYLTSAWPMSSYTYTLDTHYVGSRFTVRCGHRAGDADSIAQDFMRPESIQNPHFAVVTIGCSWGDIIDKRDDGLVRCGLEVFHASENNSYLSQIAAASAFGHFTFPFDLPRALFVDSSSSITPPPADKNRYVGLHATATSKTIRPVGYAQDIESKPLAAYSVGVAVACAEDYANVIVDTNESQDVATVPVVAQREGGGPVTESDPYFVRRPDIIARVPNTVAAADSWHATHLVRRGSSLATRNAVHHLHLEFVQAEPPQDNLPTPSFGTPPSRVDAPQQFPVLTQWSGQHDWNYPVIIFYNGQPPGRLTPNESGPQFTFLLPDDDLAGYVDPDFVVPPLWFWNAIAGKHAMTPFVGERRLFPNAYHIHYGQKLHTFSKDITTPPEAVIEPRQFYGAYLSGGDRVGPFFDAMWQEHDEKECPVRKQDYRIAWSVETYPQLWATTSYNESWAYNRPLDIPLQDSGMTTENYDAYARRNESENGGVVPWVSWDPGVGAVISVRARVGLKYTITKVQGFRRVREKSVPSGYFGGAWFYDSTGEVRIAGDHECNDVACTEVVSDFKIPLEGEDLEAISSGEEVTKQLLVGYLREPTEEDNGDPVYRTVKVKVTKEE